jgi:hypothetical protein
VAKPIIFLAFANDRDDHLGLLDAERQDIVRALLPYRDSNRVTIMEEAAANKKILAYYLSKYSERIELFHFAGHAGDGALQLKDSPAMALGLAELLGALPNLKLAFLNGCCTNSLLKQFQDQGVKGVIGTSVPIRDNTASEFSVQFYQSLAEGKNIREAFEFAKGLVHTSNDKLDIKVRGLQISADSNGEFAWGLYKNDDAILDYALPKEQYTDSMPVGNAHVDNADQLNINNVLREKLFEALLDYSEDLQDVRDKRAIGKDVEVRKIHRFIRDSLPAPLGIELDRLFGPTGLNRDRLQAFVDVYRTLIQLMTFILYSQLWDFMHEKENAILDDELKDNLVKTLSRSGADQRFDDHINVIRGIREFLDINDRPLFVEELTELARQFREDDNFRSAHSGMTALSEKLSDSTEISPQNLIDLNKKAEAHLGDLFVYMNFMCKYKFVAIKDIDLIKRRHLPPEYRIVRVNLDSITAGLSEDTRAFKGYADIQSVVLLHSKNKIEENLNLSPFLIDENALLERRDKARLFMFSHYDFNTKQIHYNFLEDPMRITKVDVRIDSELKSLFNQFLTIIFRN